MAHHHSEYHCHQACDQEDLHQSIQSALELFKQKGYKYTKKRERLLELIAHQDRYLSARQIQEAIAQEYPQMSYDTIYRNLYTGLELGVLEATELKGEKLFRFACQDHGHHHHFICQACGATREIHYCPMDFFQDQLGDCLIESHRFEVFGLCPDCLKAQENQQDSVI